MAGPDSGNPKEHVTCRFSSKMHVSNHEIVNSFLNNHVYCIIMYTVSVELLLVYTEGQGWTRTWT